MKPVKAIKDPEAFKLLADEIRRRMVFLLRVKEMTASEVWCEGDVGKRIRGHFLRFSGETCRNEATCQLML